MSRVIGFSGITLFPRPLVQISFTLDLTATCSAVKQVRACRYLPPMNNNKTERIVERGHMNHRRGLDTQAPWDMLE